MNDNVTGIDEGYVKYECLWERGPAPDPQHVAKLNQWRHPLFRARLLGHYVEHNVGYGNISIRVDSTDRFVISGTQTGHIEETRAEHYALVTEANIQDNFVSCRGPIQASSEAMTHAAIYALSNTIAAVVHVHSKPLWQQLLGQIATTNSNVAYGTPEMASEFTRLWQETDFAADGVAVMAGHDEGLVSIGPSLDVAAQRILRLHNEL